MPIRKTSPVTGAVSIRPNTAKTPLELPALLYTNNKL
ncbi:hypothetical protein P6F34_gp41 [Pseudomonas phage MiCath]|uniref:Uncharacterized protein n=1 Tax=Pseudomonas phage MiCath TaxID=3003729 RepID=A0AAF0AGS0_9CAUD|nr:hypothetical protein P6F34_gp41 [Pseudomonas phage MiCath]WAX22393.1 hypothetical protein [Pseudomonas phage MiCath]